MTSRWLNGPRALLVAYLLKLMARLGPRPTGDTVCLEQSVGADQDDQCTEPSRTRTLPGLTTRGLKVKTAWAAWRVVANWPCAGDENVAI